MTPRPKKHLEYYSRIYPSAWKQIDMFRADRGKGLPFWPEWCFCPLAGAYAVVSAEAEKQGIDITSPQGMMLINDVGIIGALAAWRVTQGIYRFDPDIYAEVINTPINGEIPHEILFHLPEWSVYIETPGLEFHDVAVSGFFAYLEYDAGDNEGRKELRLVLDCGEKDGVPILISHVIHLGPWSLFESVQRVIQESERISKRKLNPSHKDLELLQGSYSPFISLLLYLCSANGEIGIEGQPKKPKAKKTKKGYRIFPPQKVSVWDVGVRMGTALRKAKEQPAKKSTTDTIAKQRSRPRAHVRRAHWHGYWTGPRAGKQKYVLKWIAPILIASKDTDIPVTIRPIKRPIKE